MRKPRLFLGHFFPGTTWPPRSPVAQVGEPQREDTHRHECQGLQTPRGNLLAGPRRPGVIPAPRLKVIFYGLRRMYRVTKAPVLGLILGRL